MNYFDIRPGVLWPDFDRNAELTERIYELGMDRVSDGGWFYINPATGFGIFEDADGNFLFMETVERGAESRIVDMHCGLKAEGHGLPLSSGPPDLLARRFQGSSVHAATSP